MIATRDHIKAVLHDTPQNESEFIFIDLLFSYNRKITYRVFYHPPSNNPKPLEDLQAVLQELSLNKLILLGDFNLPEIDWLNNKVLRQSDIYTLMMVAKNSVCSVAKKEEKKDFKQMKQKKEQGRRISKKKKNEN